MKQSGQRAIEVWADWAGLGRPNRMGVLYATPGRGKEIFSFEYDPEWLASGNAQILDPSLLLFRGVQYVLADKPNFGLFLDSAPDRWGRLLMERREAQASRAAGRARHKLHESDYLLGVYDGHRMGALRFRLEATGPFLDDDQSFAAPPWTSLRELEHASLQLERDDATEQPGYLHWLRLLIAPGSSIGGARPKATALDELGHPWIAKFPSRNDPHDIGGWEFVVHQMAHKAGLRVAPAEARKFNTPHRTFLTRRFDRTQTGERLHFASALTLLGHSDGADASTGASYLELAEFLMQSGAHAKRDLEELWRRIVFSICVSNVDDHLRNHGFLLEPNGWTLSPAYDINPVPFGDGLTLNISEADNAQDLDLAREVAAFFRIKTAAADVIINDVVSVVRQWRNHAIGQGLSANEQERMASAFRIAETS